MRSSLITHSFLWDVIHPCPDSKVHGANTGPIWGRQDPGGPHVGPMNFVIWVIPSTAVICVSKRGCRWQDVDHKIHIIGKCSVFETLPANYTFINFTIQFCIWNRLPKPLYSVYHHPCNCYCHHHIAKETTHQNLNSYHISTFISSIVMDILCKIQIFS